MTPGLPPDRGIARRRSNSRPHVPEASTAFKHSPPHRECDDEGHRSVVPPFTGQTGWTASKSIGHEKCRHELRSDWPKFGVRVMRDTGYDIGDQGTAHYQQCQPEARRWSSHSRQVCSSRLSESELLPMCPEWTPESNGLPGATPERLQPLN